MADVMYEIYYIEAENRLEGRFRHYCDGMAVPAALSEFRDEVTEFARCKSTMDTLELSHAIPERLSFGVARFADERAFLASENPMSDETIESVKLL